MSMEEDDRTILNRRRLDAPPAAVFRAFQQPDRLARWWGPAGFRSTFHVFEFRPGGRWSFVMHGPDGTDYPNENRFETLEAHRIVVRHEADVHGFRLTVALSEAGGGTDLQWRQVFDSAQERARMEPICRPANEQNLDRLCAELARVG